MTARKLMPSGHISGCSATMGIDDCSAACYSARLHNAELLRDEWKELGERTITENTTLREALERIREHCENVGLDGNAACVRIAEEVDSAFAAQPEGKGCRDDFSHAAHEGCRGMAFDRT
jgi:hypothetical protein